MLVKRRTREATSTGRLSQFAASVAAKPLDRRSFLRASGLTVGGLAAVATLGAGMTRRVEAAGFTDMSQPIELRKNICTHCSVGCSVVAEVQNGVWVGQEPAYESPINRGTHCAKGASVRELVHGDRRLKYPMKKVGGEWQRISWDQALTEIADKMTSIRETSGADSVYFLGSAKFSNEGSYLFRKFAAFWGTNNVDHQARICHSTTVAGVANTWGYGAMTNSYNDIRNAKTIVFMGSNAAEAHPVSLQHILEGKETQRANVVVLDPRFTRTAAHATEYVRIRPGTDIAVVHGMLWHIFENGWEDKEYIAQRVWGMDQVREVVKQYTPDVVEEISGVDGETLKRVAEKFAKERPSTFIWCMGGTQHTVGTANVRAYNLLLLATGNVGGEGNGANIFRGHCNVQGATDFGLDVANLPCYYGLGAGAWKHWARVWDVPYEYFVNRFDAVPAKGGRDARTPEQNMNVPGITSTRWFDAVTIDSEEVDQRDNIKAMMVFGHGGNTVPRMQDAQRGMDGLDLLVVADPHPTTFAALHSRTDNTYLLPICTQFECSGSRTASNRSVQWGEKVVEPIFESDTDYAVMYGLAERLGFADEMFKPYELVQGKFGM
ncbi:MAG: molybdopterin-dependent oxidoreductase, partial [Rhodobacteraceae bacterium]|nr:molybdopterin-dependent oxidoreductase [Paracoccaceae bacterium]